LVFTVIRLVSWHFRLYLVVRWNPITRVLYLAPISPVTGRQLVSLHTTHIVVYFWTGTETERRFSWLLFVETCGWFPTWLVPRSRTGSLVTLDSPHHTHTTHTHTVDTPLHTHPTLGLLHFTAWLPHTTHTHTHTGLRSYGCGYTPFGSAAVWFGLVYVYTHTVLHARSRTPGWV